MRRLADECVHAEIVRQLRAAGHDVLYAAESRRQAPDGDLADEALRTGRILITEDKDFGDLAFLELRQMPPTILLRFAPQRRALKSARLFEAIARHGTELQNGFTVIEEVQERRRPFLPQK